MPKYEKIICKKNSFSGITIFIVNARHELSARVRLLAVDVRSRVENSASSALQTSFDTFGPSLCTMTLKQLNLDDARRETRCQSALLPALGLADDASFEWRVYALRCQQQIFGVALTYYVGLVPRNSVAKRMQANRAVKGSQFTAANPPIHLELLWPAANNAAEAYVFYALMSKLLTAAVVGGRLGGWVQAQRGQRYSRTYS